MKSLEGMDPILRTLIRVTRAGHWIWRGRVHTKNGPCLADNRSARQAVRCALDPEWNGPVMNTCGSVRCVNPDHNPPYVAPPRVYNPSPFASFLAPTKTGCILWTGPLSRSGLPRYQLLGKSWSVRQLAWQAAGHTSYVVYPCLHNPLCVNPDHLRSAEHNRECVAGHSLDVYGRSRVVRGFPSIQCIECVRLKMRGIRQRDGSNLKRRIDRLARRIQQLKEEVA